MRIYNWRRPHISSSLWDNFSQVCFWKQALLPFWIPSNTWIADKERHRFVLQHPRWQTAGFLPYPWAHSFGRLDLIQIHWCRMFQSAIFYQNCQQSTVACLCFHLDLSFSYCRSIPTPTYTFLQVHNFLWVMFPAFLYAGNHMLAFYTSLLSQGSHYAV